MQWLRKKRQKIVQWLIKDLDLGIKSIRRIEQNVSLFFVALLISIIFIFVIYLYSQFRCGSISDFPSVLLIVFITAPFVIILWFIRIVHKEIDIQSELERLGFSRDSEKRELFVRGAELLKEEVAAKIGGIYTLRDVYLRAPGLRRPIVETLTAYLRDGNSIPSERVGQDPLEKDGWAREDFQQIINVLGQLEGRAKEKYPLNFWNVDLRKIYFEPYPKADFSEANFTNAWIGGCDFRNVRLNHARFVGVKFGERTNFSNADFEGADFRGADLSKVFKLGNANLKNVKYWCDGELKTIFPKGFSPIAFGMVKTDPVEDDPFRP